ncbi:MAG TPA: branched-chain amino acid ABC transporter permease [Stellaceae bacterium]|nr:branched-chain amino acid ABC transporter permease [Stellaceae bacterium]
MNRRQGLALALAGALLVAAPVFVGPYLLSVLIVFLVAAYLGQCWNIMMGFAGQLSIGHALYYGLGAYTAAALFAHFGTLPWLGVILGMAVAALVAASIAALSFRFAVTGVYFALLTIAFNEFTRILFEHFEWVGGTAGLFLHVAQINATDLVHLRGSPGMFYYLLLALSAGALWLSRALLRRRIGFYWLAIREDEPAAAALGIDTFWMKLAAVTLSGALTALGGGIVAFYDNNLYPDTIFATSRSVEIITAPIIGGMGTLFGPIVGAFLLTTMGEAMTDFGAEFGVPGLKQWLYGGALVAIVLLQPAGVWPWVRDRLGLGEGLR